MTHSPDGSASTAPVRRLVLASGSPRRRQLLEQLGLTVVVRPAEIDETPLDGEAPPATVERLARDKARHAIDHDEIVLAADTIVVLDGEMLGKPADQSDARSMLTRLSGRSHEVLTGVAVAITSDGSVDCISSVSRTVVTFTELSADDIDWYVATGEPDDKAGAYAVQGIGALFVEHLDGNYSNVVGLPLPETRRLLAAQGWTQPSAWTLPPG